MKTYMLLNGLRWSRNSGSILCNTLKKWCFRTAWGGLTILNGNPSDSTVSVTFNTTGHTGTMVPIYAYGPGADIFTGIMENIDIPKIIKSIVQGW